MPKRLPIVAVLILVVLATGRGLSQAPAAPLRVVPAQPAPLRVATCERRFDALVEAQARVNDFSGTILLASQGKWLVAKGVVYANAGWQIPNTTTTKFCIGSMTKQFTSMLVMQLREQGKI